MFAYPWIEVAYKERGVREIPGPMDEARIVEYEKTTTYPVPATYADEVAWCSMFLNWVMLQCGIQGTRSAWSQSWLSWGDVCDEQVGAVVIFSWGGGKGHVGIIYAIDDNGLFVIGGNQGNEVRISYFSRTNVVGYRMPEEKYWKKAA